MVDIVDRAAEREEAHRTDSLEKQKRSSGLTDKTVADSAALCEVCEIEIPEARRYALPGVQTCVDCQADLERAVR